MKTGLYFGSFNPVHIGHMAIANYIHEYSDLDEIWFVVSPHNPLKKKVSLLPDYHRIRLVEIAIADDQRFRISDIESKLPKPSYTIDTLAYLSEKNPGMEFTLIMGSDNLLSLDKWKNADILAEKYRIIVYPRKKNGKEPGESLKSLIKNARIDVVQAPEIELSGTFIRDAISQGKDIRHFLPPGVYQYIKDMHFYE